MTTLKNVLLINALSSGATGLILIIFSSYTAQLFDVTDQTPFVAVGTFLLLFALFVFAHSSRNPLNKGWVKFIVALDVLWVIESLIIVFFKLFAISQVGYILIIAVALWVLLMAFFQARGLNQVFVTR